MKHVKRFIPLLLIALLLLAILPNETYASPPQGDTHRHNWKVIENKKPTCTKGGQKTWECTACGKKYTEKSRPLGHDPQPVAGKAPTCTETGLTDGIACGRCGEVLTPQETIPALGHQPETIPGKSPTCTETGLTDGQKCTRCGSVLKAQEIIPALGHQPETIPGKSPTCTETGLTDGQKCTRCGAVLKAQETIPALGHQPETIPGKAATCTETGLTDGQKCARCGAVLKAQEAIPALDHDWDEGTITVPPWLLTPGERTFTCKRDPSHTRTEEIPPSADAVFASLSTGSWTMTSIPPLIITEQPVGGAVTRYGDDTHLLHVAASGGQGAYTYEWKYRPNANSTVGNIISWMFLHSSGEQNEPDYEVADGDMRYWCIVKDEAGNTAQSNTAIVDYKISIAKQPDNVNLQLDDPHFYCEAIDGSGDYTYRWYDSEMGILGEGQSYPATEPGLCYCYCIVTDNVTGETATSEYCEVYDEEPFRLVRITKDCELWPEETGMVVAAFTGGTPDYEIWWDKDGTAIDSIEGLVDDHPGSHVDDVGPGKYTVHAVDAHGEVVKATCTISEKHLTILKQPQGDTIPTDGYATADIVLADGEGPYTYNLYWYWLKNRDETYDSKSNSYRIWYPGSYFYVVVDANGHTAISDSVVFEKSDFRITSQTETSAITRLYGSANMSVTAEGGQEPYTYTWTYQNGDKWFKVGGNADVISVNTPGVYACTVKDSANQSIQSKSITVTYTGKVPLIVEQPTRYRELDTDVRWIDLKCRAISGTGDDSNLRYDWYTRKFGGSWTIYAADIQSYPGYFVGEYRCKVTDTATGSYTWSEVAVAYERLLSSTEMTHWSNDDYSYNLHIKGGVAPYKIQVYLSVKQMNDPKTILWNTYTVNTLEEASNFHASVPPHWDYTYYSEDEKAWKKASESTVAYAVITDALGRTATIHVKW